jgi:hypothetical protein
MAENKENKRIIEQWINAKFDGKVVASLVQRGQFYNPQLSIIKGKEYETKLGKATQVQLGLGDLRNLVKTLNEIIIKLEEVIPKKEPTSEEQSEE